MKRQAESGKRKAESGKRAQSRKPEAGSRKPEADGRPQTADGKLKRCPVCGGAAELAHDSVCGWFVQCSDQGDCWTLDGFAGPCETRAEAVAEWNVRHDGWIDVGVELPDDEVTVVVATADGLVEPAWREGGRWWAAGTPNVEIAGVTHWQHLPQPPERGTGQSGVAAGALPPHSKTEGRR